MREILTSTKNLTDQQAVQINRLASLGFEQSEGDMLADTTNHILAADEMQLIHNGNEMAAFALYRRCLWR